MSQSTSYEIGRKAYKPDTDRGQWARSIDFVFVSLGHSFKMDLVTWLLPLKFFRVDGNGLLLSCTRIHIISLSFQLLLNFLTRQNHTDNNSKQSKGNWKDETMHEFWCIFVYLCGIAIFVVPIFLLQSFLGQFSSSSYISVFRISPVFKGIGYISVFMNYLLLSYQSTFAGNPLIFLWNSLKLTLPWSCEAYEKWGTPGNGSTLTLCTAPLKDGPHYINDVYIPSVEFLRSHFQHVINENLTFSWYLFLSLTIVWIVVGVIVLQNPAVFGKIMRYLMCTSMMLLLVCLLRSFLLPESLNAMTKYLVLEPRDETGWGTAISMASFNRFNTNIVRYSWLSCGLQVILMMLLGIFSYLMEHHLVASHNLYIKGSFYKQHWELMLCIPSALADLDYPQLWCIIFLGMLVMTALVILATQLYALVIALEDEFQYLHAHRLWFVALLTTTLIISSSYFCFNHKETFSSALATDALFTQTSLNLLLLLIVLWIYGRVRFQRDFEFMLGRPFSTWLVYLLRFVTPICAILVLWFCYLAIRYQHFTSSWGLQVIAIIFIAVPWLFIPGCVLLEFLKNTGSLRTRFRRLSRPTDWYPLKLEERRRYLEMLDDLDVNQQLREIREINNVQS